MKLYNINTDKIEDKKTISDRGTHYVSRLTESELNSFGYYIVSYQPVPNRRYYTSSPTSTLINNKWVIGYIATEKPLCTVQEKLLKALKETFIKEATRPRVMTPMGYEVDGSRIDLENFTIGLEYGFPQIIDAKDVAHIATTADYEQVISAIKLKGITLFQTYRSKKDEVKAFTTVAECILYEATPYDYTITAEDVTNALDSSLVEGTVVPRYRNKITEW